MAKEKEVKIILEREYTIPLRKSWLKVPEYKRANKAVKTIKEFMIRHMKVYDKDMNKIKIDKILNNEIRFRGMRKPAARIKVKAIKYDDDTVKVTLVDIPKHIQFKLEKQKKLKEIHKKEEKKAPKEEKAEKEEEVKEKEEKQEASKEAGLKIAEQQAHQAKHLTGAKEQVQAHRMALQK